MRRGDAFLKSAQASVVDQIARGQLYRISTTVAYLGIAQTFTAAQRMTAGLSVAGFTFSNLSGLHMGYTAGAGNITAYNFPGLAYIGLNFDALSYSFMVSGTAAISINSVLGDYANDAAAAIGGVPIKGMYRNGSVVMIRVA